MGFLDYLNYLGPWIYLIIFVAKIVQVALASSRIILMSKGEKMLGSLLYVVEMTIWLLLITSVIANIQTDPLQMVVFVIGGGIGIYLGSIFEGFLALGHSTIHIIVDNKDGVILAEGLREKGFGVTTLQAQGQEEFNSVLLLHVKRKRLKEAARIITEICPTAIFTVNESKTMRNGYGF